MNTTVSTGRRGMYSRLSASSVPDPACHGRKETHRGGKEGEIGRDVAYLPTGEGSRSLWVFDELVVCKMKSEQTGGAYSLFEVVTHPGTGPPPPEDHHQRYVQKGGTHHCNVFNRTVAFPAKGNAERPAQDR